jgi:hypothetical protein
MDKIMLELGKLRVKERLEESLRYKQAENSMKNEKGTAKQSFHLNIPKSIHKLL